MLRACRRVLRPGGRLAFTTIETAARLSPAGRQRLRSLSPGSVFAPAAYRTMISQSGLTIIEARDVTKRFMMTLRALIAANELRAAALLRERRRTAFEGDLAWFRDRLTAAEEGLIRRVLYAARR